MIRRFETYAFLPGVPEDGRRELARVVAETDRYIPEVLDNWAGWNGAGSDAELVWEHAFESVSAYRRYMVHRYHAEVLDRYVLVDSPERIVETLRGAGLFGYSCPGAPYRLEHGARRVVLLQLERSAGPSEVDSLERRLADATREAGGVLSVLARNTMADRWYDGVTRLPMPVRFTHVWEQGFPSGEVMRATDVGRVLDDPVVRRTSELAYELFS
ncbi:MAG TPA: hypothetical protein VE991_11365 [Acidimicrobiales bacterium]|nr:hypothetical protein [Acidimicrobiales bacterium]